MDVQQANVRISEAFGLGTVRRLGALVLVTLALLTAPAGAWHIYNPTSLACADQQPLLIPTPEPTPRPA